MGTYSYGIDFFTDDILEEATKTLLSRVAAAREKHNPYRNVIDPFAALFEAASLKISIGDWFPTEVTRQINKSLTNALGDFHQQLIGKLPGWSSTGTNGGVVDLKHPEPFGVNQRPALAEVKNKFNTMNSKTQEALYDNFQNVLGWPEYKNYNCYLIQIIQRGPSGDLPWAPAKRGTRNDIRIIGAQQVYAEATGQEDALKHLFKAITRVLEAKYGFSAGQSETTSVDSLYRRAFPGS